MASSENKALPPPILQKQDLDVIRHAKTDDELEIMRSCVEAAKEQGASLDGLMAGKLPMVIYLIQQSRWKSIQILAELGLNLHATDHANNNALHYSAKKPEKYTSFFIKQGVSVHQRNKMGQQPLALTCDYLDSFSEVLDINKRLPNLKALIAAGANINDINPVEGYHKGRTALGGAIELGPEALELVECLMQQPELEIHNVNGKLDSALHLAAIQGRLKIAQYLMNTGRFDLDQVNDQGLTALDVARKNRAVAVLKFLIPLYEIWTEKRELSLLTASIMASRGRV